MPDPEWAALAVFAAGYRGGYRWDGDGPWDPAGRFVPVVGGGVALSVEAVGEALRPWPPPGAARDELGRDG